MEFELDAKELIAQALEYSAAGKKTPNAISNGINWTLDRAFTAVKRQVSKQTGIRQGDLESRSKGFGKQYARPAMLDASIYARSTTTPLSYFDPSQRNAGVYANPWGRRQFFTGAFIATMKSGHMGVFGRGRGTPRYVKRTNARGKVYYSDVNIREMWGPSIAKEMLKPPTPEVFTETVNANLGPRIIHEIEYSILRQMSASNAKRGPRR